jgi:hypothetical protein
MTIENRSQRVKQPSQAYTVYLRDLRIVRLIRSQSTRIGSINRVQRFHPDVFYHFYYYTRTKEHPRRICRWY